MSHYEGLNYDYIELVIILNLFHARFNTIIVRFIIHFYINILWLIPIYITICFNTFEAYFSYILPIITISINNTNNYNNK